MTPMLYARAMHGVARREFLRMLNQHGRLAAAIVRPMLWLAVFAAGFRATLGLSIAPPYSTYILYEVYITPGLAAMMLLFHGMQTSLSMVYHQEMGSMRNLLVSPAPRPFLLAARLGANVLVILPLIYLFLILARWWDVRPPIAGYLAALPALVLAGLMLGAMGLLLSSVVTRLENFAGVMNFVIFPAFIASTAFYPLWRLEESSGVLAAVAAANPFSHAVELIRFALYLQPNYTMAALVALELIVFFAAAAVRYDPGRGFWARRRA